MNACLIFFRAVGIKVSSYIFFLISQNLHIRTFSDNLPNGERRHAGDHPTTSLHGAVYLVRCITGTEGIPVMVGHTKHDPKTGELPTEFKQCYPTGKQRCDRGTDWRFSSVWTSLLFIMSLLVAFLLWHVYTTPSLWFVCSTIIWILLALQTTSTWWTSIWIPSLSKINNQLKSDEVIAWSIYGMECWSHNPSAETCLSDSVQC